jgi:hypothetical protein
MRTFIPEELSAISKALSIALDIKKKICLYETIFKATEILP